MKAAVYHGPRDIRLEERAAPVPGPGEAVLRVRACGICGTDLRILRGHHRAYPPGTVRVPGHEIAGVVAAVGEGVSLRPDDNAFIAPNLACDECYSCRHDRANLCSNRQAIGITRDGGFADMLLLSSEVVARGNVLAVHGSVDFAALSVVEPLACVVRSLRACPIQEGDVVAIIGGGPIGLLHVLVAGMHRPSAIILSDRHEERRERARVAGATHLVDTSPGSFSQIVRAASDGRGADVVIVAAPSPTAQQEAVAVAAPGARINFFAGLPTGESGVVIHTNTIHYRELIVTGTTGNSVEDCREALGLFQSGRVDTRTLVTARYPLASVGEALASAASGQNTKVVIEHV